MLLTCDSSIVIKGHGYRDRLVASITSIPSPDILSSQCQESTRLVQTLLASGVTGKAAKKLTTVWLERDDLLAETTPPSYPPLESDITTDVLVVGGGIAGLHIAYEILQTGLKKVVIIDDGSEFSRW